ncbi:MAG: YeeE/YedE family protein [Defluviimonas sp.]|uniref:DUF6691 family protein n=1 Tax=Albidovulum sp. TaxID=1872424 RepID=UPI001E098204|nr:YeeE/YedE family protein [Paracoccaceae bacterium]MCC0064311.1 YeeE/YedE family protein [Defluviimonas sp.]
MRRGGFVFFCGGLFGLGLVVSGMTDTRKVVGWLDVFGDWDPTLAFVMAGAILPMALAWRVAARRDRAIFGRAMPHPRRFDAGARVDARLVAGSLLFGAGWGLAGFCPGPALAAAGFGDPKVAVFLLAMIAGMLAARPRPAAEKGLPVPESR